MAPLPVDLQYILHDDGHTFAHDPFTIVTSPITLTLCGGLTYTATFNGSPIGIDTEVSLGMAYDPSS
jgi:hypothetical protein